MIDTQLLMGIFALLFTAAGAGLLWMWHDGRESTRLMVRATKEIEVLKMSIADKDHLIDNQSKIIADKSATISDLGRFQKQIETSNNIKHQKIAELQQKIKHKNQTILRQSDRITIALECRTPGSNGTVVKMCEILDGTRERMSEYRMVAYRAANAWGKPVYVYSNDDGHFTHTMEKRAPSLIYKKYRFSVKPDEMQLPESKCNSRDNATKSAINMTENTGMSHSVYMRVQNGKRNYFARPKDFTWADGSKYQCVQTFDYKPQVTS